MLELLWIDVPCFLCFSSGVGNGHVYSSQIKNSFQFSVDENTSLKVMAS